MKGRTVTTSGKWPKETTRSNGRMGEGKEECLQSTKPLMVGLIFFSCFPHKMTTQSAITTRLLCVAIEDLAIDFQNLHHRAHTSPLALGIFRGCPSETVPVTVTF